MAWQQHIMQPHHLQKQAPMGVVNPYLGGVNVPGYHDPGYQKYQEEKQRLKIKKAEELKKKKAKDAFEAAKTTTEKFSKTKYEKEVEEDIWREETERRRAARRGGNIMHAGVNIPLAAAATVIAAMGLGALISIISPLNPEQRTDVFKHAFTTAGIIYGKSTTQPPKARSEEIVVLLGDKQLLDNKKSQLAILQSQQGGGEETQPLQNLQKSETTTAHLKDYLLTKWPFQIMKEEIQTCIQNIITNIQTPFSFTFLSIVKIIAGKDLLKVESIYTKIAEMTKDNLTITYAETIFDLIDQLPSDYLYTGFKKDTKEYVAQLTLILYLSGSSSHANWSEIDLPRHSSAHKDFWLTILNTIKEKCRLKQIINNTICHKAANK